MQLPSIALLIKTTASTEYCISALVCSGIVELLAAVAEIGAAEGIFAAPEGAACLPALKKLIERGEVDHTERVVLFNTGAGVKYLECFQA